MEENASNGGNEIGSLFGGNEPSSAQVAAVTSAAVEGAKRGRGRPKGSGNKNGGPATADVPPGQKTSKPSPDIPPTPVAPPIDLKVIEDAVKALCDVVDGSIRSAVRHTTMIVTEGQKPYADRNEERVALKPVERDSIGKLSAAVCQQYNLAGQHAPAIFLGVFVIGWISRSVLVVLSLKRLAAVKKQADDEAAKKGETPAPRDGQ